MFKIVLTTGSALAVLASGALIAQAQQPAPQPAPSTAPQTQIPTAELQKFAQTVKQLQTIDRQAQAEMVRAVEAQGLNEKRFLELYQAQRSPQAQAATKPSAQEQKQFAQALAKVQGIQQQTQTKMQQAVTAQGFEVPRFNQIMTTVLKDPALKQQVLQLIRS